MKLAQAALDRVVATLPKHKSIAFDQLAVTFDNDVCGQFTYTDERDFPSTLFLFGVIDGKLVVVPLPVNPPDIQQAATDALAKRGTQCDKSNYNMRIDGYDGRVLHEQPWRERI